MYGAANDGANLPGHVLSAIFDPSSERRARVERSHAQSGGQRPACAELLRLRHFERRHRSPRPDRQHGVCDGGGHGEPTAEKLQVVYRSTNGGATWTDITANLPAAPANSLAIDPQNANTVYVATDQGVYFTTQVASCGQSLSNCWSAFGSGLPGAPAVALSAAPGTFVLAGAGGGHIWARHLANSAVERGDGPHHRCRQLRRTLAFREPGLRHLQQPADGDAGKHRQPRAHAHFDFDERRFQRDRQLRECDGRRGASCAIQVTFTPQATGPVSGEMTIYANVYGGQLTVDLTGTGSPAGAVSLTPATVAFGQVEVGTTSAPFPVTAANSSAVRSSHQQRLGHSAVYHLQQLLRHNQPCRKLRLPVGGGVRAHASWSGDRPADIYRWGGHADRGAERNRRRLRPPTS